MTTELHYKGYPLHIRWMIRRDMADCLRDNPKWDDDRYVAEMKKRYVIGMVCEYRGEVVAHMIYELYPRHLYMSVVALGQNKDMRPFVAQAFMDKMLSKLTAVRRTTLFVEVPYEQHELAAWLNKQFGFHGSPWSNDEGEECLLLTYRIQPAPAVEFDEEESEIFDE